MTYLPSTASPVGGVAAHLKSLTGVPTLLNGWVECNGQTLSDAASLLNGQVIPNLNASGGGTQRFLRGATTSGTTGGTETHAHTIAPSLCIGADAALSAGAQTTSSVGTLPSYYQVVWVVRIR